MRHQSHGIPVAVGADPPSARWEAREAMRGDSKGTLAAFLSRVQRSRRLLECGERMRWCLPLRCWRCGGGVGRWGRVCKT